MELDFFAAWLLSQYRIVHRRVRGTESDRGDVPGWVMVTVMTAGLVVAIFAVFNGAIKTAVQDALSSVVSGTKG